MGGFALQGSAIVLELVRRRTLSYFLNVKCCNKDGVV